MEKVFANKKLIEAAKNQGIPPKFTNDKKVDISTAAAIDPTPK